MKGFGYGFAELGINCVEIFLRLHLLVFYTQEVGLNSSMAGLALGLAIFWDALIDPVIGYYSDRVRFKRGERYSFLPWGLVFLCVSIMGLLNPPPMESMTAKFLYLLGFSLLVNTAYTCLSVPYSALVGDLAVDSHERSKLIGWRLAFGNLGAIFGIAVPGYFLIARESKPYALTAWMIVLLLCVGTLVSWYTALRYNRPARQGQALAKFSLFQPLKNHSFMPLLAAYFVANIGLTFNSSVALYFYREALEFSEKEITAVLLLFLLSFTISIPGWLLLVRYVPKRQALMWGVFILGMVSSFIYPMLPPEQVGWALLWASGVGGVLVGSAVLLESLLTDIVKAEEDRTGQDELGLYFGVWKMVGKVSRGVALAVTGQILTWALTKQPEVTHFRLGLAFGPLVGSLFILAVLLLWKLSNGRSAVK
ncbi:MFS transporter [Bdellovibrio bacteriovorus]|uniref:Putative polysaccharide deacetylase n=1 Tax=Bdellovibrio bacteriovorus (strain ATCC 15356 / DSM 50701 / NCIMB 9529 / HD100) TaxID=264462 RepID=Q6MI88_BDEBA|nr:MFS transporter [Bdellovibrio bacteriovorus]CAE78092.1 putative polysaccharide deacetylase [Bdellovibrio bacteriovorus HD100]